MKRTLLLAAVTLGIFATAASAQNYRIELSADNAMSSCAIAGDGSGLVDVHVFLTGGGSSTGMVMGLAIPACWSGATWLGDVAAEPWLQLGDSQHTVGWNLAFGECRALPLYIGHISFAGVPSSPCCEVVVTPASPGPSGMQGAVDCTFDAYVAVPGRVLLNATSSCPCDQPLASEQSTWGRVKSLYR